jgi:hypothetical protein
MSVMSQVLQLKLQGALADVPADVLKAAVDVCKRIGADTEIMPGVPSLEVLAAAAGILSERERLAGNG